MVMPTRAMTTRSASNDRAFAPWLYRIARNRWHSHYRSESTRALISLDWLVERLPRALAWWTWHDPIAACHAGDLFDRALSDLSAIDRAILLHWRHGFSFTEIGAILVISPAAAQRRAHRAVDVIRRRHAPAAPYEPGASEVRDEQAM